MIGGGALFLFYVYYLHELLTNLDTLPDVTREALHSVLGLNHDM